MELDLMNLEKKKKKSEGEHGSTLQVFKGHLPKGVQTGGSEKKEDTWIMAEKIQSRFWKDF